ncbi:TetR/AcrR family transcriptional regulator [Nocardioides faecalis]|uniref:TetR/AcrR family transcriptional regulator n=1 Tax=Nocardioides faecalis TaxID=2803858 RepID=UPI0027DCD5BE|nr:TetR/AcrR family transcriptional regulator [Nocardioides faecalis]
MPPPDASDGPSTLGDPAPAPARRRTRRQLDLLDRLVDLLVAEGFLHLTLDEVSARLHCSKTTLYALADSKADLAVQVVRRYVEVSAEAVEARVAEVTGPRERVATYLAATSGRLRPLSGAFLDDVTGFRPTAEVYRSSTAAAADRLRELIAEGVASGAFRPVHAAFAAEMATATMFAVPRGDLTRRLGLSDTEAYAELGSLLLHALASDT